MVIFDIGACVGLFIDDCIQKYKFQKLYAFEPLIVNYEYLVDKYKNDNRIFIYNFAISNYNGVSNFYKKIKNSTNGNYVGNAGCSLQKTKDNVSKTEFDTVEVIKISDFIRDNRFKKIDICKIDTEGEEYNILADIIDNNYHEIIDKIMYEDHCRKIPKLSACRDKFLQNVKTLNIEDKFYLQNLTGNHTEYSQLKL